jgi:FMN phosphatase YigB (HAD superfamily)
VGFRAALEALGVKPEEALHVGDLIKNDIRGAKKTGISCAREQEYLPEDAPDYIIMSLSEVIGIVETLL